ncbi:MAG TPA: tRNA adenosine(34) deaminase TadA [Bacilli bacterium]|nr:tRNA adenosine(34) deaminase TadA [Bacilli bacterium]
MVKDDRYFMKQALKEAKKAISRGEVPVGCVIVKDNEIIARSYNKRDQKKDVLGHAEIGAIQKANKKLNAWILEDCTIYVTLEPCLMCAGAILQSRIKRLVYAAKEPKFGAVESVTRVLDNDAWNHKIEVTGGVLEEESSVLLKSFFQKLRMSK